MGPSERGTDDALVPDGHLAVNRQPDVRLALVFHRAADVDILIPFAPVRGQAALQPQDALGDEQKLQVAAPADHLPGALPPRVGLLQQKVGAKAGVHPRAGRNQIAFVPPAAHGEVKVLVEKDLRGVLAVCAVDAVDIAVLTALAVFAAAVPGIPVCHFFPSSLLSMVFIVLRFPSFFNAAPGL